VTDATDSARRWREIRTVFEDAVELPPAERAVRLEPLRETDPALRDSVLLLLAADDRADEHLEAIEAALLPQPVRAASPATRLDPLGLTGRTLSHFRILGVLGVGGMGLVYRAEDMRLARKVALKVPLPDYRLDGVTKERFLREARSAAVLDHPNVCSIHEVGESPEGQIYLAMPLYPGETLGERLRREDFLSVREALEIARQVAEGLAAAHQAGIVHRDVKPGNMMLLPDGTVKILDFGLAKVRNLALSESRGQLGTVAYMAPEQIRREPLDERADLWALGVMLYEMLTGRRPFEGEHEVSIAHAIVHLQPERPSAVRPGIPHPVEGLLLALLRKEPGKRPPTARQVATELRDVAQGRTIRPGAPGGRLLTAAGWARRPTRLRAAATLLVACLALTAGAVLTSLDHRDADRPVGGSVAVLPFANLSGDPRQEYLSDGITEELMAQLARAEWLRVTGRASTFRFKGSDPDARDVGEALGVSAVLRGSVRRDGPRLRITAQLIEAASGRPLWSETFDRELGDIFSIQVEIGRAIASALQVRLAGPADMGEGSTRDFEAYELYLKGRYFWNQRTEEALVTASDYFRQAVAIDPDYARAYSGLADVEIAPRSSRPAERFARAHGAAARALALDETLPDAHASLGWIQMWLERDWKAAEGHFRRALELSPTHAWAVAWYAAYLAAVGRIEESLPIIHRAHELDPLSYVVTTHVGTHYLWLRREDQAVAWFRKALELSPDFYMAHWGLARVHLARGRYDEALRELRYDGSDYAGLHRPGLLGYSLALAGHEEEARHELAVLRDRSSRGLYVPPLDPALIHIGLGENQHALDWLARLEEDRGIRVFLVDPIFDPVRSDPRFARILEGLRLPASLGTATAVPPPSTPPGSRRAGPGP